MPIRHLLFPSLLSFLMSFTPFSPAYAKEFTSSAEAANVIELYTSEGCNSCPPAERWLNSLKEKDELFKSLIPMAFHVDYWNYLGWNDRFSSDAFSQRQRRHTHVGNAPQVYTPQVIVNSKNWRGWFFNLRSWGNDDNPRVGILKAELKPEASDLLVSFDPASPETLPDNTILNVAVLGMGLETNVKAGENRDRHLKHDFVVLNHSRNTIQPTETQWRLTAPNIPEAGQKETVLVVWLSEHSNQNIIQAVAGYL